MDGGTIGLAYAVFAVVAGVASVFFVPHRRPPSSALAWIFFIALLPIIGLLAYLLIGNTKLPRKRRRRRQEMDAFVARRVAMARRQEQGAHLLQPHVAPPWDATARLGERLGAIPVVGGNRMRLLEHYDDAFAQMVRAIDEAKEAVHLQFFILAMDRVTEPVFAALERAAKRGVAVRVLFDHVGSMRYKGYRRMLKRFDAAGIEWHRLLPLLPLRREYSRVDLRNHRKVVVVDGGVGFTGSQNVIARDYHHPPLHFIDTWLRIDGPAATALDTVFLSDWYAETGVLLRDDPVDTAALVAYEAPGEEPCQVLPSGPAHDYSNNMRVLVDLVYAARRRVVLVNPYFVPNAAILTAVTSAAQRGVDVRLVTHEIGDSRFLAAAQRSYYDQLLRAGVKVFLLPHPTVLHSKCAILDDDVAVIGSSNLDTRSLYLHLEVDTIWYSAAVVRDLEALQKRRHAGARELDLDTWRKRPLRSKAAETLARLTSDLI